MNFELTEEQKLLRDTAYKFALKEFTPIAKECDREEKYPRELWKKACETGLVGVFIPEEYGGPGMGFLDLILITEQMCRIDLWVIPEHMGCHIWVGKYPFFRVGGNRKESTCHCSPRARPYLPVLLRNPMPALM